MPKIKIDPQTVVHSTDTFSVREFLPDGSVFSTFGSYDDLGDKYYGAIHSLRLMEGLQHGRPFEDQHTFKIIKQTTVTFEVTLDDD